MRATTSINAAAFGIALLMAGMAYLPAAEKEDKTFILRPIGQVRVADGRASIVLEKAYQPGLRGLEGFSHIYVLWWFDKNDTPQMRSVLQVRPRGDQRNPQTGVFATRAPMRPNLIGMSICKVISVKENVIEIEKIDAFDSTPVLDIKPYRPGQDCVTDAAAPAWARPKQEK